MKKTRKILIPVASLVSAAALVGSVSGAFAWFQYSTRTTAAFTGASAHCSENIEISVDGTTWHKDLTTATINSYLTTTMGRADAALRPVTTGEHAKDAPLGDLYKNPIYQYEDMEEWDKASADYEYIEFPIYLRVLDINGGTDGRLLEKNIYLTDVTIKEKAVANKADISDAIRVHYHTASEDRLISTHGNDVESHGKLDLNNDGTLDRSTGYEWDTTHEIDYGIGAVKGTVADLAALAAIVDPADGDVYFVTGVGYKKYDEAHTSWGDYAPVAESYALDDALAISDDSDPYAITGTPIGRTVAGVNLLADLPVINEVRSVTSLGKKYQFNGTAWVAVADSTATTKAAVAGLDQLITPAVNDVYYAADEELPYKWNGSAWVVNADHEVADLPTGMASIGDSYHQVDTDKNMIWNGKAWVEGGDGSIGNVADASELEALILDLNETYYKTSDKIYKWSGNGDVFNEVAAKDMMFKINVTIYLEGWQQLVLGEVADQAALEANYLDVDDSYHVTDIDKDMKWTGTQWVEGGDGSKGTVATMAALRSPNDAYRTQDTGKIYVYNGSAWVEGKASAIWNATKFVQSQVNVGMRFSSEAHNDH